MMKKIPIIIALIVLIVVSVLYFNVEKPEMTDVKMEKTVATNQAVPENPSTPQKEFKNPMEREVVV